MNYPSKVGNKYEGVLKMVGLQPPSMVWYMFLGRWMTTIIIVTLWLFNIAMENDPFIDGLPGFTY